MDSQNVGPWAAQGSAAKNSTAVAVVTAVPGPLDSLIAKELSQEPRISLQRRCADIGELLGLVQAGIGTVAIIGSALPGFDRQLVAQLRAEGVETLAINDSQDQYSAQRIAALGVRHSISTNDLSVHLAAAVLEAAVQLPKNSAIGTRPSASQRQVTGERDCTSIEPGTAISDGGRAPEVVSVSTPSLDLEKTFSRTAIERLRQENENRLDERIELQSNSSGNNSAARITVSFKENSDEATSSLQDKDFASFTAPTQNSGFSGSADELVQQADGFDATFEKQTLGHSGIVHGADQRGKTIVVWSGHGAPGRSTIAAGLAFALAQPREVIEDLGSSIRFLQRALPRLKKRNRSRKSFDVDLTLLIDADTYAPAQAQALGLLEESSGLAQACRSANAGLIGKASLAEASLTIAPSIHLLTGIPRHDRWPEISASALEAVLEQATRDYSWVVVDCAPSTELDEVLMYGSRTPQRNGATLTALGLADLIVIVGKPDPVGIKRLINAANELRTSPAGMVPHVIAVNHAPSRVSGKGRRAQISKALKRFANVEEVHFLAYDLGAATEALDIGRAITERDGSSELVNAIHGLAQLVESGFMPMTASPK